MLTRIPHNFTTNRTIFWTILLLILTFCTDSLLAQSSEDSGCNNENFELGNLDGWTGYHGIIRQSGEVIIDQEGFKKDRHTIMDGGYDPIALQNCIQFDSIPTVAPGGRYSLRLGNADIGSDADRILKTFLVTPENNYFVLKYAVILNDPDHEYHEQPRFEMRILDEQGTVYDCGEYLVRAAAEIEGFESCENGWRVRPWTTASMELQSFIGQTITIEFLTTDCAQSGHAGYAYVDASCRPLKVELEGYCPEASTATLSVGDGFGGYLWSTGDTTSTTTITDPKEGDVYSVELTSATGCTVMVYDTIPAYPPNETPFINSLQDRTICKGDTVQVSIEGEHIGRIYWNEFKDEETQRILSPDETTTYHIYIDNESFCTTIEETITVEVIQPPEIYFTATDTLLCQGESTTISFDSNVNIVDFQWLNENADSSVITITPSESKYVALEVTDEFGCTARKSIKIEVNGNPNIWVEPTETTICANETIELSVKGNDIGSVYWPTLNSDSTAVFVSPSETTMYPVQVTGVGCDTIDFSININVIESAALHTIVTDTMVCAGEVVELSVKGENLGSIYWTSLQRHGGRVSITPDSTTTYPVRITDANLCDTTYLEARVQVAQAADIFAFVTDTVVCQGDSVKLAVQGTNIGEVYWPTVEKNAQSIYVDAMEDAVYPVQITDQYSCNTIELEARLEVAGLALDLGDDIKVCEDQIENVVLDAYIAGGRAYRWQDGTVGPSYRVSQVGEYIVEVVDSCGTTFKDKIQVRMLDCDVNLPTAFSPNNDGINDLLQPLFWCDKYNFLDFEFKVFDRWGTTVFQTNDIEEGWDGSFQHKNSAVGVFIWYIRYTSRKCEEEIFTKGNVTLVR